LTESTSARPSELRLYGAFSACGLIWGSTFLAISIGNDTVPPMWAAGLRLALAAPLLVLIGVVTRQPRPRGAALRAAMGYGVCNLGIGLPMLYWAEKKVPSGLASVIYATVPLTSMLLTRAFGLERITWIKVAAAVVGLVGVAVIFSGELGGGVPAGPLLAVFLSTVSASLGTVLLKRGPPQSPISSNAVATAVGCVLCVLASVLAGERHALPRTFAELFPIVYLTVAGSIGAYVFLSWLVNYWDVTRISFVSLIVPIVAVGLGSLVRHERLSGQAILGSLLVLAGVLLRIQGDRDRAPSTELPATPARSP